MSTELDLSFGASMGFALAVMVHNASSAPASAVAGDSRARLIDLIYVLTVSQVMQGKHMPRTA